MRRILIPAALLALAAAGGEPLRRIPSDFLGGSTANIEAWDRELGYVGNPNVLGRQDRTLFTVDFADFIDAGRVESARLTIRLGVFGQIDANHIEIEKFPRERPPLVNLDLLSQEPESFASVTVERGDHQAEVELDVTGAVNAALYVGYGALTFRLRNATTETLGNRHSQAEGVSVTPQNITLELVP